MLTASGEVEEISMHNDARKELTKRYSTVIELSNGGWNDSEI